MRIVSVLLFGVAAATSSFENVVQELLTAPEVPLCITVEACTADLDDRLGRLASAYEAAVQSVGNDDRIESLRESTENDLRRIRDQVTKSVGDLNALQRMAIVSHKSLLKAESVRKRIVEAAYREYTSEDELIGYNLLRLTGVSVLLTDWLTPGISPDSERAVREFEELNHSISWTYESSGIRALTRLNAQYLRIRIQLLANRRNDLLEKLETAREQLAGGFLFAARRAKAGFALEEFERAAEEVAMSPLMRTIFGDASESHFNGIVEEGKAKLNQLARNVPCLLDREAVAAIRLDAENKLVEQAAGLQEMYENRSGAGKVVVDTDGSHLPPFEPVLLDDGSDLDEPLPNNPNPSPEKALTEEEFLDRAHQLFESPLASAYVLSFEPEFFDGRISKTLEEIARLCDAVDSSVDAQLVAETRMEVENHVVAVYEDLKRACIAFHVGQL